MKWQWHVKDKSEGVQFRVERLTLEHDISRFISSNCELTRYLREDAYADQSKRTSVTHLLVMESGEIIGYFTLLTDSIRVSSIGSGNNLRDYPYSSIPALKIARLSTSWDNERKGLGTEMLNLSFRYLFEITKYAGCRIVTVDSKNGCEGFYEKYGFRRTRLKRGDKVPMYLDVRPFIEDIAERHSS